MLILRSRVCNVNQSIFSKVILGNVLFVNVMSPPRDLSSEEKGFDVVARASFRHPFSHPRASILFAKSGYDEIVYKNKDGRRAKSRCRASRSGKSRRRACSIRFLQVLAARMCVCALMWTPGRFHMCIWYLRIYTRFVRAVEARETMQTVIAIYYSSKYSENQVKGNITRKRGSRETNLGKLP